MTRMEEVTQAVNAAKKTGHILHIRPQDSVLKIVVDDDSVKMLISRVTAQYLSRETRFQAGNIELLTFTRKGRTWKRDSVITPDPNFVPSCRIEAGSFKTPEEHKAQMDFERDCHRPGQEGRLSQRDSFDRAVAGYGYIDTEDKLYKTLTGTWGNVHSFQAGV